MSVYIVALAVFGVAIIAMSVGVWVKGKCLKGTCGGLNQMRDESGRPICEACAPEKVRSIQGSSNNSGR